MIVKPSSKGIRGLFVRMRERLHIHREAHPERRPERVGKGEKSDRPEKQDRGEGLDAAHPGGLAAAPASIPHEDSHGDLNAPKHGTGGFPATPLPNGSAASVMDAHGAEGEAREPEAIDRVSETPSPEGQPPRSGNS
jgi:hypothetical protein